MPQMMKAIRIDNPGPLPRLTLAEEQRPKPTGAEILVKVEAAALNRADLLQAQGRYPAPQGASSILGLEAAGTVAELGPDAREWQRGDRVCVLLAGGGYAQYCLADEGSALPVPKDFSMLEAAALPEAYFTVWTNIIDRAHLAQGETLLVHGGSSGIGTTAIALFAALGHSVLTTAGTDEKCALCERLGASRAINYNEEDFVRAVKDATAGKGVDVILDMVGGAYIAKNLQALAVNGRLVNIAYQSGSKAEIDFLQVMLRRLTITGSTLRIRSTAEKRQIRDSLKERVWPLLESGRLKPVIDKVFRLQDAGAAHARMAAGVHAGKIILSLEDL